MDQALAAVFHGRAKVSRVEFGVDVPALEASTPYSIGNECGAQSSKSL